METPNQQDWPVTLVQLQDPASRPIIKSFRPSRPRHLSSSRGARSSSHRRSISFPPLPRSEASATARTPTQTPSPLAPAEESMNTAPSAASSLASSPSRQPPQKRRSPSSDAIAPHERDVGREAACFLESFEQCLMTRFTRLEERVAPIDTRVAAIDSHLVALDATVRVTALETRKSATEATLAHRSPPPLTPAPPTPPGLPAIHHGQAPPTP
ncbi:hypothetical protein HPB51_027507 [Rhipicephalus microplus]|uniref:Uncharacterized protein n=1 Tax=Rhipicephalus microplus TaxID=6941 RepID=A0A9J6D025_RHIMP|nr:hypothetical protein HPB51_027507 [Rhipicephalus microplus]